MGILSHGKTDIGLKRKSNQDAIYLDKKNRLFVVADGMGGHNGGDIASDMAVNLLPQFFYKHPQLAPDIRLRDSCLYANYHIYKKSLETPKLRGMGTTLVSFYFDQSTLYIANVGDSRAYLIQKEGLFQLTRDHSLVQEKLNLGIYDREDAADDRMKNVLVRTVGYEEKIDVDIYSYKVCRNDIIFLCSDGLYGKVSDSDLTHLITKKLPDPQRASQEQLEAITDELVAQANQNGGHDNISVILTVAQ